MSAVLIASITRLCIEDHQNNPQTLSRWLSNKSPEGVGKWFDNAENTLLVAERDGALAAVGGFSIAREIILNYVSPAHRFAGVSRALLAAMEAEMGPGAMWLTSTATARRFYQSAGWAESGEIDQFGGMAAFRMRKRL